MDKKPYSKSDYEKSDRKSKIIASRFMMREGKFRLNKSVEKQLEAYKSHDIVMIRNSDSYELKIEVEQKLCWKNSGKWQGFNSIDIPYRKKDSQADTFIMFNSYWDTLAVTGMHNILGSTTYQKNTVCSNVKTTNEFFFKVDLGLFRFFKSTDEDKYKWIEIDPFGNVV